MSVKISLLAILNHTNYTALQKNYDYTNPTILNNCRSTSGSLYYFNGIWN